MKNKLVLDLLRNYICLLKLPSLASLSLNFSATCSDVTSKFINKSAQKGSIFSSKANYARGLLNIFKILFCFALFLVVYPRNAQADSPEQKTLIDRGQARLK